LFAILPYGAWVTTYFVADDWPVILRNTAISLWDVPKWFLYVRYGWYRPLFELYMALSWRLFGLHPIGYHLLSLMLFAVVAWFVGQLAWLLTSDQRIRFIAMTIFALQACHSTAVMWISSANELLAGLFAIFSLVSYITYRIKGKFAWCFVAIVSYLLAVTTKETVLYMPVIFLFYDWLFYEQVMQKKRTIAAVLPALLLLVLTGLNLLLHPPIKAAALSIHPLLLGKNVIYYLAMQLCLIPTRFYEVNSSLFSLIAVSLASFSIVVFGLLSLSSFDWAYERPKRLALIFGITLALAALAPVIFEIWERTTFMSSIGVALCLAMLFVNGWDGLTKRRKSLRPFLILALGLWLSANLVILLQRNSQWGRAGSANQAVIAELENYLPELSPDTKVQLINLPDRFGEAYTFRNTFPSAGVLIGYLQPISATLDVEMIKPQSPQIRPAHGDSAIVRLAYENGHLVKLLH
jgi:uncharacterized membrane protein